MQIRVSLHLYAESMLLFVNISSDEWIQSHRSVIEDSSWSSRAKNRLIR